MPSQGLKIRQNGTNEGQKINDVAASNDKSIFVKWLLDTNSLLFWFSYQVSYNLRNRQSIET
jgi:hypothetical protein